MKNTKLTQSDVIDIRREHSIGRTTTELANMYNVDARHIRRVIDGTAWSDVPYDRILKNFSNYAVTIDGRIFSFNKNGYMATEEIAGKPYVRLSKTDKHGNRIRSKVAVSELVKSHF